MITPSTHYVIPALLERDWEEIEKKLEVIKTFSDKVHIDVLDIGFDPEPFSKYKDQLFLEAHLMTDEPVNSLKTFYRAGFKRFIGHAEKISDQAVFVARGELYGEVGLALDLESPIDLIKVPFEDLDFVSVMSVKAGKQGQELDQSSLEKIESIRSKTDLPIEVDGGINDQTLRLAKEAGANYFVAGSFILNNPSPKEAFQKLEALAIS
ncbi:MAG TPA: HisA/HisF-related TIM barrel protein [Patescibacteria group bacterium]|nr:HisA/HisF-related TIM barrel protein [Patescibacteria group bacterium]